MKRYSAVGTLIVEDHDGQWSVVERMLTSSGAEHGARQLNLGTCELLPHATLGARVMPLSVKRSAAQSTPESAAQRTPESTPES